jgi:uncharacterized protein YhbP (UPF0306 family)
VTASTRDAIRWMLEAHSTATLATVGEDGPWAATVFYASDADLNFYFVSDPHTRHGRDLEARSEVAVAINADCRTWSKIRGLQVAGRAEILDGAQRAAGLALYLTKFDEVKVLFEAPRTTDEGTIAQRLQSASLYRLTPHWIRLIDNTRGFGHREELVLC